MKNLFIAVAIMAMFNLTACGQKENVPTKVKASFSQKFPDASKVKWDKENAKEWEAEFKMNGTEYSANFNAEGKWMETEYEIKKPDIPAAVKATLDTQFKGFKIEEAEVSKTSEGTVYEFAMENNDTDMEVAISPDGKVVKKEVKKEDEDKD